MYRFTVYLTFHGIGTAPPGVPADEVPYWIDESTFADTISEMVAAANRMQFNLVVTFDDGNRSDLEIAAPLLEAHGVEGMFFPCAGRIGQMGYLDASDLRALKAAGFSVGSHGMDHLPWATVQGAALHRETVEAKCVIEAAIKSPVTNAALPFGSYNHRSLTALREAGFEKVLSSDPGLSRPDSWFTRRFSYQAGRTFDLEGMVAKYGAISQRVLSALRHQIKALR